MITTLSSDASLISTSIQDDDTKNIVLYIIGIITILIQSIKNFIMQKKRLPKMVLFLNNLVPFMTLQLGMSRADRMPSEQLSDWALKEYERLQQDALPLSSNQVELYRKTFANSTQSMPDICEDEYIIKIYKNETENNI